MEKIIFFRILEDYPIVILIYELLNSLKIKTVEFLKNK